MHSSVILFSIPSLLRNSGTNHQHNAPVPLAGDATALIRRTKKLTDTQQDRRDGLVEHLRRCYFACVAYQLYQWRIGDAHAAHMAYEWRWHCVWCRVWELDHCVFTAQVAYAQRTSHERAGVWRAYVQRMGCVHAELMNTPHNMWAVNVTFKCPWSWIHMYLNVLFHLSNLIMHGYHRNEIVLITGRIIC